VDLANVSFILAAEMESRRISLNYLLVTTQLSLVGDELRRINFHILPQGTNLSNCCADDDDGSSFPHFLSVGTSELLLLAWET